MIAKAFKPVVWVAGIGGAALSCYMLSLQVASERAELASVERRIVATRQDIRQLQTELGTRGRMQQLEQWNAEVLALAAPVSGQFLDSNVSLARFDTRTPALEEQAARVQMASADVTTMPGPAPSRPVGLPAVQQASLVTRPVAPASIAPVRPTVQRASVAITPAPRLERAAAVVQRPAPAPAAGATRSRSLLDESTLRALGREARNERQGGTRN